MGPPIILLSKLRCVSRDGTGYNILVLLLVLPKNAMLLALPPLFVLGLVVLVALVVLVVLVVLEAFAAIIMLLSLSRCLCKESTAHAVVTRASPDVNLSRGSDKKAVMSLASLLLSSSESDEFEDEESSFSPSLFLNFFFFLCFLLF